MLSLNTKLEKKNGTCSGFLDGVKLCLVILVGREKARLKCCS
jgi:hypothetical protein